MTIFTHLNNLLLGQGTIVVNGAFAGGGGPSISQGSAVVVAAQPNGLILQSSRYWYQDNAWGAFGLTVGTYSSMASSDAGTTYYLNVGVAQPALSSTASSGPIKVRMAWGFPRSTNEVKAYPAIICGARPGWSSTFINPGGFSILLPDGVTSSAFPSGATPFNPFPVSIDSLSAGVKVNVAIGGWSRSATGSAGGHLAFDIWLQNDPGQGHGFSAPPITHEIMIPLDYWGSPVGYGSYPNRNPSWYISDTTIQGLLWHMYYAPNFNGSWKFIVFEPDVVPVSLSNGTIEIGEFILKAKQQGFLSALDSISGVAIGGMATHLVDVEFGVEPVDGQGDLTISGFGVTVA